MSLPGRQLHRCGTQQLPGESRAFKRYAGLPSDTPLRTLPSGLMGLCLVFGSSGQVQPVSLAVPSRKLRSGPPISWETRWGTNCPSHRAALDQVIEARGCRCCVFSPDCGVWSVSNSTMDPSAKSQWRNFRIAGLEWVVRRCRIQPKLRRSFVIGDPHGSAIFGVGFVDALLNLSDVSDTRVDMCMHGLVDETKRLLHQKPTVLRGSLKWKRTGMQRSQLHAHKHLQGFQSRPQRASLPCARLHLVAR